MITFEYTPPLFLLLAALLVALGAGLYSAWRYLPRVAANATLPALYAATLALLGWCLLQPGCRDASIRQIKPRFLVALDTSASMALSPAPAAPSRFQQSLQALAMPWVEGVSAEAEVDLMPFDIGLGDRRPVKDAESLEPPGGTATRLRDNLRDMAARYAGLNVAGVLLLSDGRDTREATDEWAATPLPFPVYTVRLEDPDLWTREPDVRIDTVVTPRRVNSGWESEMKVIVSGQGTGGQPQTVQLFRDGRLADETPVQIPAAGGQREAVFTLRHDATGVFTYRIQVPPLPGETQIEDNEYTLTVAVLDNRNRLLYVEGVPRFEYRFLRRVLLANEQIVPIIFFSGADGSPQSGSPGTGVSAEMTENDLLQCKIVILGNMDAKELTEARAQRLRAFVENGGSLVMLGGTRAWGADGLARTALQAVLPVRTHGTRVLEGDTPFRVQLEPEAKAHPAFAGDEQLWSVIPPVLSVFPDLDLKPGAMSLVTAETPRGRQPLVVTQRYGQGRVAAIFTDSLWRWQLSPETAQQQPYARFWSQLLDWMLPDEDEDERRRIHVFTAQDDVHLGDHVEISARFADPDSHAGETLETRVKMPDGRVVPYAMTPQLVVTADGRSYPGFFLRLPAEIPGHYSVVAAAGSRADATTSDPVSFNIRAYSPETVPRPANEDLLRSLSASSGGRFFESLHSLDIGMGNLTFSIREEQQSDFKTLWRRWALVLLLMALLGGTWTFRKLRHMP